MQKVTVLSELSVGIDLHKTQFTVCVISSDGEILLERQYETKKEGYQAFIKNMHDFEKERDCTIALAIEATCNARFFRNMMIREFFRVVVVNTNRFELISKSTKKTDKHDAAELAYYLSKDMLPESHLCDEREEEIRRLLKTRSILVSTEVKIKNQVHGMLLGHGEVTKSAQLQSKKKRQALVDSLGQDPYTKTVVASLKEMFTILDSLIVSVNDLEKYIKELVADDEDYELLNTIPGVGFVTAATISCYTKDLDRFEGDYKRFCSYAGLTPYIHSSNKTEHIGHITKHGPVELRTSFVQMCMGLLRNTKKTGEWRLLVNYQNMKETKGSGKSIIATSRKLARIVFVMLSRREEFNPSLMIKAVGHSLTVDEIIGA
ncbi:MAG: IS110 family transposase [Epsilonproteobacteria bacterium]|nr:IS110 family transposase [Campylobacterota bacterium]